MTTEPLKGQFRTRCPSEDRSGSGQTVRVAGVPSLAGLSHIDLTVTDVSVSRAFYTEVLGFVQRGVTTTSDFTGVVIGRNDLPFTIGLNWCAAADGTAFDEMRTGLDHLSFLVPSLDHLEAWQETLRDRGVVFTPIVHVAHGDVLVFRDPDNISWSSSALARHERA